MSEGLHDESQRKSCELFFSEIALFSSGSSGFCQRVGITEEEAIKFGSCFGSGMRKREVMNTSNVL